MSDAKTFYITTAIDYVNARPHLGTAYEKIGADCLARYKRLSGFDTYFLMGTDEHSTNVEKEARKLGKTPEVYSAEMAKEFEKVWKTLHISYDQFIRTDLPIHKTAVEHLFQVIHDNGYIHQGTYKGFYCASCEEFVQEKDLEEGGLCPRHKEKAEWLEEKNYFFALSKFGDALKKHIDDNPGFIRPEIRRNEILNFLARGLEDVSVSRVGKSWGVALPIAEGHVVYVWFDALINYISALGYGGEDSAKLEKYWPADCHVIGKDITRFHCLIWPAMLMAADIPIPKEVYAHGFVYSKGTKMSKTIGNILDPVEMAGFFGADPLRYLLLKEIAFDRDGDFTVDLAITRYNAELANELGNLFSRTLSMLKRYRDGALPGWTPEAVTAFARLAGGVVDEYCKHMDCLEFDEALDALWKAVQSANRYVEERKPWVQAKADEQKPLDDTLRVLLEILRLSSILCIPFMPEKSAEMREQLCLETDISKLALDEARKPGEPDWKTAGTSSPLFPKIDPIQPDN